MRRLLWGRSARRDLFEIARWYGDIDSDLPFLLLERVELAPLALLESPNIGSPFGARGLRKWRVRQTPLILLYRATAEAIEVRRVLDARSDYVRLLR